MPPGENPMWYDYWLCFFYYFKTLENSTILVVLKHKNIKINILTNIKANILTQWALFFNVIKGCNFQIKGRLMQNNQVRARLRKHAKPVSEAG